MAKVELWPQLEANILTRGTWVGAASAGALVLLSNAAYDIWARGHGFSLQGLSNVWTPLLSEDGLYTLAENTAAVGLTLPTIRSLTNWWTNDTSSDW
ncbi:MAG: hypothetical protein GY845_35400 [Planctomycetes bacterium]|nr:hypothetical protein [Planctomycetota bacterium]